MIRHWIYGGVMGFCVGFACRRILTWAMQRQVDALQDLIQALRDRVNTMESMRERAVDLAERAANCTIVRTTMLTRMAWSGDVVLVSPSVRIAIDDIPKGGSGWTRQAGTFELAAAPAESWPEGKALFWHPIENRLTREPTPFVAGGASEPKGAGADRAKVNLCSGVAVAHLRMM